MITTYSDKLRQGELPAPTAIRASFFQDDVSSFSLDFYYGPYDTPENGKYTFSYEDEETEEIIVRPNSDIDDSSVWHLVNNQMVYKNKLYYQQALAKQMLTDANQFFVGKKVCFIDEEGKPVEYFVVPDPENEGELHFEDASSLSSEVYRVLFNVIPNSGASGSQAPVEVGFNYYTLPVCKFTPPTDPTPVNGTSIPMLFLGWRFGYTNGGEVVLQGDTYDAGEAVNLKDIVNTYSSYGVTNDNITFYATYTTNVSVDVDFENGFYDENDIFNPIDLGNGYGYIKVKDSSDETKPLDWEYAWSGYFTSTNGGEVITRVTSSNYELYKDRNLFVRIIRDSYSLFNNGSIIGNTIEYDTVDYPQHPHKAVQYASVQLNTTVAKPYDNVYVFDHWEITAYGKQPGDDTKHWIEDYKLVLPFVNSWFRLEAKYTYQDQATITQEAAGYKFRGVFRKMDGFFSTLRVENNYADAEGPTGTISVTATYKTPTNTSVEGCVVTIGTEGVYERENNCPDSIRIIGTQAGHQYLELDPEFVSNVNLEATASGDSTFYAWSDGYEDHVTTIGTNKIDNISILHGQNYRYKAWFVFENDITATLMVGRRKETPTGGSMATVYNGSTAGIYDWVWKNTITGETTAGHYNTSLAYLTDVNGALVIKDNSNTSELTVVNNELYNTASTVKPVNRGFVKSIDLNKYIGTIVEDVQVGQDEYFIYAEEGEPNGAKFQCWNDGVTTNPRLVKPMLPMAYKYVAVFQGAPMVGSAISDSATQADIVNYEFIASNNNNNPNIVAIGSLPSTLNDLVLIEHGELTEYYSGSDIITEENLFTTSDYTVLKQIVDAHNNNGSTVGTPTVVYDYNGNQYKEADIVNGVTIEIQQ